MNPLVTPVTIPQPDFKITYRNRLFFMGSCFSEYMGKRLKDLQFQTISNPFGVLYNPMSVSAGLEQLLDMECYTEEDLSFYNELWFSYSHYTLFSHTDKEACLSAINKSFTKAKIGIDEADFIFLTLGTSWVYYLKESGKVVANCHKQPASFFDRNFLPVEKTVEVLKQCIERISKKNPSARFIFTISPIRHWKDGAIGNQRSKAALILAIDELQKWNNSIYYFPAYEIFMDELRDYRFYAGDMLHPSESAQNFIFSRFVNTFISEEDQDIIRNIEKILTSIEHKPRFPDTESYRKFRASINRNIAELKSRYTYIQWDDLSEKFSEIV